MRKKVNGCVDCGLPCLPFCPNREVYELYCDECGKQKKLYEWDGKEMCIDCIEDELDEVEV